MLEADGGEAIDVAADAEEEDNDEDDDIDKDMDDVGVKASLDSVWLVFFFCGSTRTRRRRRAN